jgi:hypothetical protein
VFSTLPVPRFYKQDKLATRSEGKFPKYTPVRDLHMAFQVPYIYNYIKNLCRQQAEVIQNHENANVPDIGKSDAGPRKYKKLKLDSGQAYDRPND